MKVIVHVRYTFYTINRGSVVAPMESSNLLLPKSYKVRLFLISDRLRPETTVYPHCHRTDHTNMPQTFISTIVQIVDILISWSSPRTSPNLSDLQAPRLLQTGGVETFLQGAWFLGPEALDDWGSLRASGWFARLRPLLGASALRFASRYSLQRDWLMIECHYSCFCFSPSCVPCFRLWFLQKHSLSPLTPWENLNEGSPLAVSRNIFQHLYRSKLLQPQNHLKKMRKVSHHFLRPVSTGWARTSTNFQCELYLSLPFSLSSKKSPYFLYPSHSRTFTNHRALHRPPILPSVKRPSWSLCFSLFSSSQELSSAIASGIVQAYTKDPLNSWKSL